LESFLKTEAEAIRELKQGKICGLKTLVDLHQQFAVYIAAMITRDRQMAEDVVSECFLTVYDRIDQFDENRPFRPWFYRIVVNAALKMVEANSRFTPFEDTLYGDLEERRWLDVAENPGYYLSISSKKSEIVQAVREAISELTPRQRAVIVLRYYLDMSEGEISERLGIPKGTVKSRASAAILRMRKLLQDIIGSSK
jgi:RNA polymerase sigma factor (sigma-70 family)